MTLYIIWLMHYTLLSCVFRNIFETDSLSWLEIASVENQIQDFQFDHVHPHHVELNIFCSQLHHDPPQHHDQCHHNDHQPGDHDFCYDRTSVSEAMK